MSDIFKLLPISETLPEVFELEIDKDIHPWHALLRNVEKADGDTTDEFFSTLSKSETYLHFENCSPNEDSAFDQFLRELYPLVNDAHRAALTVDSNTRDSRPQAEVWKRAYNKFVSKTSWCLSRGNPNVPTWESYKNSIEESAYRIVNGMKSNFRTYLQRIDPLITNTINECHQIGSASTNGGLIVEGIKQISHAEEVFYFGLSDEEIGGDIERLKLRYQSLDSELTRAINQLIQNFQDVIQKAEENGNAFIKSISLIDDPNYDGLEQYTEGEQRYAYYVVYVRQLQKFVLINDRSGRIENLFNRANDLFKSIETAKSKYIRNYPKLPNSAHYIAYADQKKQYGQSVLISLIERVAAQYFGIYELTVKVGDMSYEHGGTLRFRDGTGAHKEHKYGQDVDMVIPNGGVFGKPSYDGAKWKEFLILCCQETIVKKVYFSDQNVIDEVNKYAPGKMKFVANHADHCHVSLD